MAFPILPLLKFLGQNGLKYGPVVVAWLSTNPDIADRLQHEVQRLRGSSGEDPAAMRATLRAMREQVEYLRDSADDETERLRARAWAVSLTKLEHAVALLGAGSAKAERRRLRDRVDALRAEILDAFLTEQIEDAGGPAPVEP